MTKRSRQVVKVLDAAVATGIGSPQQVEDYQHIIAALHSSGNATFTVKFQGSVAENMPDFSAAQSPTNSWEYMQVKDLQNGASIDGSTGVAATGTDLNRMFEVNTNGLRWVCARITAYTGGAITVLLKPFNDS